MSDHVHGLLAVEVKDGRPSAGVRDALAGFSPVFMKPLGGFVR